MGNEEPVNSPAPETTVKKGKSRTVKEASGEAKTKAEGTPRDIDEDDASAEEGAEPEGTGKAGPATSAHPESRHDKAETRVEAEAAKQVVAAKEAIPKKKGLAGISRIPIRRR